MMKKKKISKSLTFDDVLLLPNYADFLPQDVLLETFLTANIGLKYHIFLLHGYCNRISVGIAIAQ